MFDSVEFLSDDSEKEDLASKPANILDHVAEPEEEPRARRRGAKRKRQQTSENFKKKLADRDSLKAFLQRACVGCKQRCMEKFKPRGESSVMLNRLVEFREDWAALHKLDQDRIIFERMQKTLIADDDAGPELERQGTEWIFLGVKVCLKAWKRLHAIGILVNFSALRATEV